MKFKVCGLTHLAEIQQIMDLKADYLGFIFYPKSQRFVLKSLDYEQIKNIDFQGKVGVFVNESFEKMTEIAEKTGLSWLQLHGDECPILFQKLKQKTWLKLIKVIRIAEKTRNLQTQIDAFSPYVDAFLFDTDSLNYGGTGHRFDWSVLRDLQIDKTAFLSGGLSLENQDQLKNLPNFIKILDINSKFETSPGRKNIEKINEYFKNTQKIHKKYTKMKYNKNPDNHGYYGDFGGAFVPEMLYPNVIELQENYLEIIESEAFQTEYQNLLKNYVGRATPLFFAQNLSQKYGTNIYLKREDLNHTGAHKINNALGQVLLAKKLGKTRIIAETGAGQHGVATATACALLGFECRVYMGEIDIARQAPNVARMKMLGAKVMPVSSGSKTLKDAVNEALRDWINHAADTHYVIGSVVGPHPFPDLVARFQSVISFEIQNQLQNQYCIENPDYIIACVGGGSNAAGAFYHFIENEKVKLIAAEAAGLGLETGRSAATTFLGTLGVLHGSKSLVMQTKDGQVMEPHSISAGLDYPGIGPMHAYLHANQRAHFFSINDAEALESALELSRLEGIIPALESAHALAIFNKKKFFAHEHVVVCLSGRGDKDMETYLKEIQP